METKGMSAIKAIPTDYSDTRFRSKSEAIFARAMDLTEIRWEYEPDIWTDYTPDFAVHLETEYFKYKVSYLIEYKPSEPTQAYVERLQQLTLPQEFEEFYLVYGNTYDQTVGFINLGSRGRFGNILFVAMFLSPLCGRFMDAKDYRFDLAEPVT